MTYSVDWRTDTGGNLIVTRGEDDRPRDLADALEALTSNGFEWIRPEEIAALTDAPIIGRDVVRDDSGKLLSVGEVWWYPGYQVRDPLDDFMERSALVFELAPETPAQPEIGK